MPNRAIPHIERATMESLAVSHAYCRAASVEPILGLGHWIFYATRRNCIVTKLWVIIQRVFAMTKQGLIQIFILHGLSSQTPCSIGSLVPCSLHHHYNVSRNNELPPLPKRLADMLYSVSDISVVPQTLFWQ